MSEVDFVLVHQVKRGTRHSSLSRRVAGPEGSGKSWGIPRFGYLMEVTWMGSALDPPLRLQGGLISLSSATDPNWYLIKHPERFVVAAIQPTGPSLGRI